MIRPSGKIWEVACDEPGCRASIVSPFMTSREVARVVARDGGWASARADVRLRAHLTGTQARATVVQDFCPEHDPTRKGEGTETKL